MSWVLMEPVSRVHGVLSAGTYFFHHFTPPANALLVVTIYAKETTASVVISDSAGEMTWLAKGQRSYLAWPFSGDPTARSSVYAFSARTGATPAGTTISFSFPGDSPSSCMASCVAILGFDMRLADPVRQFGSEDTYANEGTGLADPAVTFPLPRLATDLYLTGLGLNRTIPGIIPPNGWTELWEDGIGGGGAMCAYRFGGETGPVAHSTGAASNWAFVGLVIAGHPGTLADPCGLLEHDYTIGTFDLYLAEIADDGTVGADQLVGNISTGSLEDDTEDFDGFATSGSPNEPGSICVRTSMRLPFTTDEITCENLMRLFSVAPALAEGADRFGFDAVTKRKIYRATLEHTMPCGHAITVRLHRVCVVNRASWVFSADTVHALQFELKAFPDDSEANPFGYLDRIPDECAVS